MSRPGARYGRLKCGAAASWFRLETRFGKGPGWVIPHTGVQKLKVQVRAGGVAGLPHGAQALPRLNLLTLADKQVLQMGIDRFIPAGVQQTDIIAIARMIPGYAHHPACGSINRCTLHSGKIRTGMELLCFALHGINAGSVSGGFNSRFARQRILEHIARQVRLGARERLAVRGGRVGVGVVCLGSIEFVMSGVDR